MHPLKLYTDETHYSPDQRHNLVSILKALWNERTPAERRQVYGIRPEVFVPVSTLDEADFCLLPMLWGHYVKHNRIDQALALAQQAQAAGKPLVVWSQGDLGINVPIPNALVFQFTLHRSRRKPGEYALPPIFDDNVAIFRDGQSSYRKKGDKPVVGFCGQAVKSPVKLLAAGLRNTRQQVDYALGRTAYEPPPIVPHTYLRSRVLDIFQNSSLVTSNFITRSNYWAGIGSSEERNNPEQAARKEFIENLDSSDYIISVRGVGNWSKRFYEALNWGRIPVLIDTDCVLPYDFAIDWKQYCVWVDQHEIRHAPQKVADFHAGLSPTAFVDLQHACRKLWLEWLSHDGFYLHFHEHLTRQTVGGS